MEKITPLSYNNPSFGMAVRFNKSGKKFFDKVFEKNPKAGQEFIKRQSKNKTSDIFVSGQKVSVGIDAQKWQVLTSIINPNATEGLILVRKKNIFHGAGVKTVWREGGRPLENIYGEMGKPFAIAEEIANWQSRTKNNQSPSLVAKIVNLFKND